MRYGRSGRRAGQRQAKAIPDGSSEAVHSRQDGIPLGHPIGEIVLFARMISPRSLPRGRSPAGKRKLRLASRVESQSGNVPSRIHPAESINQFS
jgi:hypothetical protein